MNVIGRRNAPDGDVNGLHSILPGCMRNFGKRRLISLFIVGACTNNGYKALLRQPLYVFRAYLTRSRELLVYLSDLPLGRVVK